MLTLNATASFHIYSCGIAIGPIGCFIYLSFQLLSQYKYGDKYKIKDKRTFRLLLVTYIIGILCGITGFSIHITKDSGLYCKLYGMALCFGFLGGGKAIMYLLFITRAKIVNGGDILSEKQRIMFDIMAPIYVTIYWLCYLIGVVLFFPGVSVNPLENSKYNSFCVFDENNKKGQTIFFICAFIWDLFNCIMFLYIFIIPLYKLMKSMEESRVINDEQIMNKKRKWLNLMKWNCILSFVATFSSMLSYVFVVTLKNAIWGSCLGDPLVNCTCAYFMIKINRSYCVNIICCKAQWNQRKNDTKMSVEITQH